MEIDIDVYFWMVDRGVFDDDQRNKVEMERNKVKMHREHSQRLENGFYIAKLMNILKKSVMKISRKPFSLDPNLGAMKDNITSTSKQQNWNIICKELKKFGIRIDSEKKAKIIEGRPSLICDILTRLFDFDNNGGQSRFGGDGISSEINFPGQGGSLERDHSGARQNDSTNISIDGKESLAIGNLNNGLQSANKRGGMLDPLSPGVKKSKLPQNLSPSPNMRKLKGQSSAQLVNQSVTSLNDIQEGKDLGDSETTLEFILVSLAQNLGIKPKQAAGLLSNNHKYLIHIAVKGMKGSDFSKIHAWYQNIYGFAKQLTQLIDHEKESNAMKLTLNILKCGLYSQNVDLVITCARVLSKIGQEINQVGGQLAGYAWDWFTDNSGQGNTSNNLQAISQNTSPLDLDMMVAGGGNLPNVLNESGLQSCLYAMKKFPSDVITTISPLIIHYGKNNYTEFFSLQLRRHFPGDQQRLLYIQALHDIILSVQGSTMFYDAFISSGALDEILTLAIQMADFDPSGQNKIQERISALSFLGDVWDVKADRIEENHEVAQAILTVLKRGCRDRMRLLRTTSFELMFKLLHNFSVNRNQFAPIIYKSLTFLLIEFHPHVEIREQLMRHFLTLFQQVQTIPVAILCEPLLKQIAISGGTADFNIFDFEFFGVVANHKRATVSIGIQIIDTMVQQAISQVFYSNSATSIVLELIHRFSREQPMHQHMSKVTADLMSLLDDSERWKKQNQGLVDQSPNSLKKTKTARQSHPQLDALQTEAQTVSLARKMRERLVVNFLKQIILFGIEQVKEDVRTQILRGYARLEQQAKIKQPKSLNYLLSLYQQEDGSQVDVPQMLQYFMEQEKSKSKRNRGTLNLNPSGTNIGSTDHLDDFLLDTSNNQQLMLAGIAGPDDNYLFNGSRKPTKAQLHLEKAMKEIEKIKNVKEERLDKKHLEEELKRLKDEQMKVTAKKQVERRQLEHGVLPQIGSSKKLAPGGMTRGMSVDQRNMMNQNTSTIMDKNGEPLEIKIIKSRDIDDLSEIPAHEEKRVSLLPADELNQKNKQLLAQKNNVLKQLKEYQLYDLRSEEQKDQDAVRFFVKKHIKVLRNLFNKYANSTGPINQNHSTFEDLNKQNQIMNVSEVMRLLKDFQVNTLQVPQKLIMQMFRAINKDLIKRNGANSQNGQMTTIDFEGFVEFLMQLSVHLYSYDSAMTPAEYLQKLFEHFRNAATKTGSNLLKLFQAAAHEDPNSSLVVSGVLDNNMVMELNKRLAKDPNYQLPDGYQKVSEKEIENRYVVPPYFNIQESKKIAIETLDNLMFLSLGIHLLEPMTVVKETLKARPILKSLAKDKVMSELTSGANKNVLKAIMDQPRIQQQKKRTDNNRSSNSVDQNPIKTPNKNLLSKDLLKKDDVLAKSQSKPKKELPPPPRVELGVILKVEVAKQPADKRPNALEAAYTLEELLQAVEQNQSNLPRLANPKAFYQKQVKPPPNKMVEDRINKQDEEVKAKKDESKKLEIRKKLLKEQLEDLKVQKQKKDGEKKKQEEEKKGKQEERKKKNKDKLLKDMESLKVEFAGKREKKLAEEAEKKANDPTQNVDPVLKLAENKEKLKERKQAMIDSLQAKAQDRKEKVTQEEVKQQRKQEEQKQKSQQIKQMYADTKEKTKELKDRYKAQYKAFKESPLVKQMYGMYEKPISALYEKYAKADPATQGLLTYNDYMKFGKTYSLYPAILSSQDFIYVYKTQMKLKKIAEKEMQIYQQAQKIESSILDIQGTRLTLSEFKECLLKLACLGKLKLGGNSSSNLPEDVKLAEYSQKQKVKNALTAAATSGVLKKPKDELETGFVNEDLLNVFEKEFDVGDMTQYTLENLFKHLQMKPDAKALKEASGGGSAQLSPVNSKPKSKIGGGTSIQPSVYNSNNTSQIQPNQNQLPQQSAIRQTSNGASGQQQPPVDHN